MDFIKDFFCCVGACETESENERPVLHGEQFFKPYQPPKEPWLIRLIEKIKEKWTGTRKPTWKEIEEWCKFGRELALEKEKTEQLKKALEEAEMLQQELPFAKEDKVPKPVINIHKKPAETMIYSLYARDVKPEQNKKPARLARPEQIKGPAVEIKCGELQLPPPFPTTPLNDRNTQIYLQQNPSSVYPSDESSMKISSGVLHANTQRAGMDAEMKLPRSGSPVSVFSDGSYEPFVPGSDGRLISQSTMFPELRSPPRCIDEVLSQASLVPPEGGPSTSSNLVEEDCKLGDLVDVPLTPPASILRQKRSSPVDDMSLWLRLWKLSLPYMDMRDYRLRGDLPTEPEAALIPLASRFASPVASGADLSGYLVGVTGSPHQAITAGISLPEPALVRGEGFGTSVSNPHPHWPASHEVAPIAINTAPPPTAAYEFAANFADGFKKGSENLAKNLSKGFSSLTNSFKATFA